MSAIICTYNREFFLNKSLASLIQQSLKPEDFEIIIVDNNSTDGTADLVKKFQIENPNYSIHYILEKRQGLSFARNTGWRTARSNYVYYLDDDGVASLELLETFLHLFESHESLAACGGKIIVDYDPIKPNWLPSFFEVFYGHYDRGNEEVFCEYVPGGNSAWNVQFLEKSGGFSEKLGRVGQDGAGCEESLLNARALEMKYKLVYTPKAIMYHYAGKSRLNLKWLLQRMRGQGQSSAKLILIKTQKKHRKRTSWICITRDLKSILGLMLKWGKTEEDIKKEFVKRLAFFTEKVSRIKNFIKYNLGYLKI